MNNLELYYLKDVAESQTGPFGSQLHQSDYVAEGTPIVTVEHLGIESFTHQNLPFVSDLDKKRLAKYVLREGDIVFSRVGSVDRCTYVTKNEDGWMFSGRCIRVRANSKADGRFLNFYFRQEKFKKMMLNISVGATMPSLNTKLMDNIPLMLPSLNVQKEIAKVLSDLDAKIELNNKINKELEAMAKTLYDYWFVQFDFPAENGKPYKSSGGKMVWSEELRREIPEGWEALPLFEGMNVQYGFPFDTNTFTDDINQKPVIRIRDILENSISTYSTQKVDEKYRLNAGDLLIGMDGNFHLNFWDKDGAYLNQRSVRIRSYDNTEISNFQALFQLTPYIKAREQNVSRTTVGHLSDKDLKRLYVLNANRSNTFNPKDTFDSMLLKIVSNRLQNQELASLRDWLLPMLMNGQVRVGDEVSKTFAEPKPKITQNHKSKEFFYFPNSELEENYYAKRKALAMYIVNRSLDDKYFGDTKLMKLLHLSDYHAIKRHFGQNFYQLAAGPYDAGFIKQLFKEFENEKLFIRGLVSTKYNFKKGINHENSFLAQKYFTTEELKKVDFIIDYFASENFARPEIISTLYAVWNNRIINGEEVTNDLLKKDFLEWDSGKKQYKDRVLEEINNMKMAGIVPNGWGNYISKAKGKK